MAQRHDYCSFCGKAYATKVWPRHCDGCGMRIWLNPTPVAVAIVPVLTKYGTQILAVRRSITPGMGELALPGGFMQTGETSAQGACRELREETGIRLDHREFRFCGEFDDARLNLLLLFWTTRSISDIALKSFVPNEEASECVVVSRGMQLAFPTHTKMLETYYASRSGK